MVIAAASYNPGTALDGAQQAVKNLKNSGVTVVTVNMVYMDQAPEDRLKKLSTPGYDYFSNGNFGDTLKAALAQSKSRVFL